MSNTYKFPESIAMKKRSRFYFLKSKIKWLSAGFIIITATLLALFILKRFSLTEEEKLIKHINKKEWVKASLLNFNLLQQNPEELRFLYYGAVINFGIFENKILDPALPFYEYEKILIEKDIHKIFIKESFFKKFEYFPESKRFLKEYCTQFENLNHDEATDSDLTRIFKIIDHKNIWEVVSPECINNIFSINNLLSSYVHSTKGEKVRFRENPSLDSKVIYTINNPIQIIIKTASKEELVSGIKNKWYFVLDKKQNYGWIFGEYIDLQKKYSN